jgi:hypothetical protein
MSAKKLGIIILVLLLVLVLAVPMASAGPPAGKGKTVGGTGHWTCVDDSCDGIYHDDDVDIGDLPIGNWPY